MKQVLPITTLNGPAFSWHITLTLRYSHAITVTSFFLISFLLHLDDFKLRMRCKSYFQIKRAAEKPLNHDGNTICCFSVRLEENDRILKSDFIFPLGRDIIKIA